MKKEISDTMPELSMPDPAIVLQNGHSSDGPVAVVALANALLDMFITVKDDTLTKKYELPCDGQVEITEQQRDLFAEILKTYPVEYVAGGSAQNTVRLVARLMRQQQQQSQHPSYVIGKIGRDRIGTILQHLLAQDGVLTRYVEDERLPTGCCAAIVRPDGTRCLAADLGAARDFCSDHLDRIDGFTDLLDQTAVLYVEGFFASHSPDAALAALRHAHSHGGVVRILSLSAPYVCRQFYSEIRELLPYASLVVGNEDEFKALADHSDGLGGLPTDGPNGSISTLAQWVASSPYLISTAAPKSSQRIADFHGNEWDWMRLDERLAVVTCGARGAVCATSSTVWEFPLTAAEQLRPEETVDTTGAGDAFLAGFLTQMLNRRPLADCVSTGQRTARLVIGQIGCRLP